MLCLIKRGLSPAGALFGQYVRQLGSGAALQSGVGHVHVNQTCDLRHVAKCIFDYHHVITGTCGKLKKHLLLSSDLKKAALVNIRNRTVFVFKKERRSAALQFSAGHDGDSVPEQIGFVHEVRGEQDGTTALLALQQVPGGPSGRGVHSRGGLVQHHNLTDN